MLLANWPCTDIPNRSLRSTWCSPPKQLLDLVGLGATSLRARGEPAEPTQGIQGGVGVGWSRLESVGVGETRSLQPKKAPKVAKSHHKTWCSALVAGRNRRCPSCNRRRLWRCACASAACGQRGRSSPESAGRPGPQALVIVMDSNSKPWAQTHHLQVESPPPLGSSELRKRGPMA